jgi:hypothetical protein
MAVQKKAFGVRLWCSLDERAIGGPDLLNAYELAETQFLTNTVRPGHLRIDAGANMGYHALHRAQDEVRSAGFRFSTTSRDTAPVNCATRTSPKSGSECTSANCDPKACIA